MKTLHLVRSALLGAGLLLTLGIPGVGATSASEDVQALFDGANAFAHVEALVSFGPRVAGTSAEWAAADYIAAEMESMRLDVSVEALPITRFEDFGATLAIPDGGEMFSVDVMTFSPPGEFTAGLVDCGLGFPGDCPASVAGNIALIQRGGGLRFAVKAQNAADSGAVAAVIYNNAPGFFLGTLGSAGAIPTVSLSREDGLLLGARIAEGPITVHLDVDSLLEPSVSFNVIGTLEGIHPEQGIVYLGAHYDSVSGAPGAHDDASGVAAMLEAARVLAMTGHRTKATIKFLAFGAEELGLLGSLAYVNDHEAEVTEHGLGMVNLDMIAVGPRQIGFIGYAGPELTEFAGAKADAMGLLWEPFTAGTNSDHTYFEQVGLPVAFIAHLTDPWYHTPEDRPDKLDPALLEENGELAAAVVYGWAKNPVHREAKAARIERVHVFEDRVHDVE